jgi:hypothetical protein
MILFALLGVPAFSLFLYAVDRWLNPPGFRPAVFSGIEAPPWYLLWGFLYGVPCLLLAGLLGRIFGESYRPFPLYLHLLARDHLFQASLLALAFFTFLRDKRLRQLAYFSAGYLSLIGLSAVLSARGMQDAYELFMLPALRMSDLVLLPLLFWRARERPGLEGMLHYLLLAVLPLAGGMTAYLYARSWPVWAGLTSAVLFAASLVSVPYFDER